MLEMKNEKNYVGFFSINMANFEAFRRTKKLISNLFFLKSAKSDLFLENWNLYSPYLTSVIHFLNRFGLTFTVL